MPFVFRYPKTKPSILITVAQRKRNTVQGPNPELSKKGYIGFDWQDKDMSDEMHGYSYYRFFNAGDKHYWVYTINNGGGTGEFTSIYLVKRIDANKLHVDTITGGDRCNSGVQDVTEKDNKLSYTVNLTAYDVTQLAKKPLKNVQAYDDLAACAVCCVAKASFEIDPKLNGTFKYVEMEKVAAESELPEQGKYQACFNKLTMDYMKKDQLKLEQSALDTFVDKFRDTCVK